MAAKISRKDLLLYLSLKTTLVFFKYNEKGGNFLNQSLSMNCMFTFLYYTLKGQKKIFTLVRTIFCSENVNKLTMSRNNIRIKSGSLKITAFKQGADENRNSYFFWLEQIIRAQTYKPQWLVSCFLTFTSYK